MICEKAQKCSFFSCDNKVLSFPGFSGKGSNKSSQKRSDQDERLEVHGSRFVLLNFIPGFARIAAPLPALLKKEKQVN